MSLTECRICRGSISVTQEMCYGILMAGFRRLKSDEKARNIILKNTGQSRMSDQEQANIRLAVARLKQEHADFDAAINAMIAMGCDQLRIQRMKKKKLAIKDKLQDMEDQVIPDIIA